ncbi:methyl-accepting chemotaxis protein [Pseudoduganella sp. LjRoot289]|uniref:methyl-accepting chemotaxis protein n=1 Tax=Pseudoduganella sp. LjRoot289 TaxID=3342314 RepID=UPI003ECCC939
MLKDLSIKKKLYFGFGGILAILLALLVVAYNNFIALTDANRWDRHTMEVLVEADRIDNTTLEIQSLARGFFLNGNETGLQPLGGLEDKVRGHIAKAISLTSDNPQQQARFKQLDSLINDWLGNYVHKLIELRRSLAGQPDAADQLGRSPLLKDAFKVISGMNRVVDAAATEETRLSEVRAETTAGLREKMLIVLSAGGAACLVLGALIAYLLSQALLAPLNNLMQAVGRIAAGDQGARAAVISGDELGRVSTEFNSMAQAIQDSQAKELADTNLLRAKVDALLAVVSKAASGDLTGQVTVGGGDAIGQLGHGLATMFDNLRALLNNIQKAGIQVTTSATEIAASAKQQEATGVEQAQTSVEVLSTTREISSNTAQLLRTMEGATAVADYTTSATAEAQGNLKRMDETMQHMVSATDSISAKLAALSEKASNINSVLTTITKVADQTNILSLNAAIEAEKAGEAGRGFSVVATEIRRLADQTSVSTWDIEQMLKEMQSAVSASVMGMDKFSEEVRRSVGEVRQVTDQLSGVMDQVQKLAPQFDAVLQGMQSQAVGAQQITETMTQLNDATQQTVESLRSTSEAVHQLQYAAGDLQASVANFAVSV